MNSLKNIFPFTTQDISSKNRLYFCDYSLKIELDWRNNSLPFSTNSYCYMQIEHMQYLLY